MKHKIFIIFFTVWPLLTYSQNKILLEQALGLALEKNYDVQLSRNTVSSTATDKKYVVGAFVPTINATATDLWNNNSQKQISSEHILKEGPNEANNLNASVQLSWTLFDGTKMFATRKRINELNYVSDLNLKDQMVNTISTVIINYYNIVRQKQQLEAIREQMSVSEERVKLAEKKLQVGTGAKPELLQAQVDLNAQRTQIFQQETIIIQLKDQLNGLLGMQLPEAFDVSDSIEINLNLPREDFFTNIENKNFGLQASRNSIDVAGLSLRERRAERYPTLNFVSAYNYIRNENAVSFNSGNPLFSRTKGLNYGFTLAVPIVNGFNNRRLVSQAKLTVDRQTLLYEQRKMQVDVGVRNAFINYENAKKILVLQEENIVLAKENVFIALEGFKRGFTTFIELRTAQQSLADAYNQLIAARYNTKLAETELLRLNGGLLK